MTSRCSSPTIAEPVARWPRATSIRGMTRHPDAEIETDAPLETVWRVMLDADDSPAWNPFAVKAECQHPPRLCAPLLLPLKLASCKCSAATHPRTVPGSAQ